MVSTNHGLDEAPLELVVDAFGHDEALGRDAGLSVVDGARLHCRRNGFVQIGAGHHDEGIAAAQFKDGFLDAIAALGGHRAAGRLAARESGGSHAIVGHHGSGPIRADEQRLESAIRKARPAQDIFDRQGALRHV
jgi:hypothetical protein